MLKKILDFFIPNYQTLLDSYITSRNPTSEADVERFRKEFERRFHTNY